MNTARDGESGAGAEHPSLTASQSSRNGEDPRHGSDVRLIGEIVRAFLNDDPDLDLTIADCLHRICEAQAWSVGHGVLISGDGAESASARHLWHMGRPEREDGFREATERMHAGDGTWWRPEIGGPQDITIVPCLDDQPRFQRGKAARHAGLVAGAIVPIRLPGEVTAYFEFFSTDTIAHDRSLVELLDCIAMLMGQLLQRRLLDKAVSDSLWLLQRRVGRELHDSVCQDLVGLAFLGRELAGSLREQAPELTAVADELNRGIDDALSHARAVSKGLCPIDCDADELPRALGDLVDSSQHRFDIDFTLDCPDALVLSSDEQARHLYVIAHEAVTNAIKHSHANRVHVALSQNQGVVTLRVRDDGVGLAAEQDVAAGIGMRVMRHRADVIGANLEVRSDPARGTMLTCGLELKETGDDGSG